MAAVTAPRSILVVGGGGREHALVHRLARDPVTRRLYAAPGNPGTAESAENVPVAATDTAELTAFAARSGIDLVVVGPEAPLTAGLADALRAHGIACFGPGADGARLEGSKAFAKSLMAAAGIPTAGWAAFTHLADAAAYLNGLPADGGVVVKADGLAAGKGVYVCDSRTEALDAAAALLDGGRHGDAGRRVVIEERLTGEEVSVLAVTDGRRALLLPAAQDHKRIGDHDTGPNTGGMGAYSPVGVFDEADAARVHDTVFAPLLAELGRRGIAYRGVLYAGLMLTADGPKVLEFNARFGDPECEVIVPRIGGDFGALLYAAAVGDLGDRVLETRAGAAVTVVLAADGYPDAHPKGMRVLGLHDVPPGSVVFHAGTAFAEGEVVTTGGRVFAATGFGPDVAAARERAYAAAAAVVFDHKYLRRDIAARELLRVRGAHGA